MKEAVIIDYGSGNISSVYNAVKKVSLDKSCKVKVTSLARDLKKASHIILPGVGSFESCVTGLEKSGVKEQLIESVIEKKTPFLGICVGMQMLATKGYENGEFLGLNWVKGEVKKINTHIKTAALSGVLVEQIKYEFNDELVSSDIVGSTAPAIYDSKATIVSPNKKNIILYIWYDNEFGYSHQVIRLAKYIAKVRRFTYY